MPSISGLAPGPTLPDHLHIAGELEEFLDVVPRLRDIVDDDDAYPRSTGHGCFSPGKRTDFGIGSE
jgi:hypothetical protein